MTLVKQHQEDQIPSHTITPSTYMANVAGTCLISCLNSKWIVDSDATDHTCSNIDLFET